MDIERQGNCLDKGTDALLPFSFQGNKVINTCYSIGNMLYYGISADVAVVVCLVYSDPPEWTEEVLGESEEYFGNIAKAVSHPMETMAQSANDTYEEEGLTYTVSYVVADIVIGKAAAGEFSKAKVADKADDVADVTKVTNKADDVADVSKAADKTAGVKKLLEMIDEELAKLGYKRYGDGSIRDAKGKCKENYTANGY